jgi:hypothetical protein
VVVPLSTANSPITFPLITPNFADKMATLLTLNTVAKWPSPNYVDPVKHGPALLVVNVLFFSLMTVVLALRLISKVLIKRSFGVDDILICVAWVYNSLAIQIPMVDLKTDMHLRYTHRDHHWYGKVWLEQACVGCSIGLGPAYDSFCSDERGPKHLCITASYRLIYADQLLFLLAANFTICSMLAFYYRLRRDSGIRWFNWSLWAVIVVNWLGWVPFFLLHSFPCR